MDRAGLGPLPVRPGQPLELAVDTSRLHFFDPATGESIGHPLTVTNTVPA